MDFPVYACEPVLWFDSSLALISLRSDQRRISSILCASWYRVSVYEYTLWQYLVSFKCTCQQERRRRRSLLRSNQCRPSQPVSCRSVCGYRNLLWSEQYHSSQCTCQLGALVVRFTGIDISREVSSVILLGIFTSWKFVVCVSYPHGYLRQ